MSYITTPDKNIFDYSVMWKCTNNNVKRGKWYPIIKII